MNIKSSKSIKINGFRVQAVRKQGKLLYKMTDVAKPSVAALRAGAPAAASAFDPAQNVFRIRTDTYGGSLHPSSSTLVSDFVTQVSNTNGGNAALNTNQYNAHTWLIAPNTPCIKVEWNPWKAGEIKRPLWDQFARAVPWPANAVPSSGNDRAIILYDPYTYELWEFWKVRPAPGRPGSDNYYNAPYSATIGGQMQASFGGYIADTRLNRGVFDTVNGSTYGTSATSMSYLGCAITVADIQAGVIDHALPVQLVYTASNSYTWPAERTDGAGPSPIREGQRFRFPPTLDVSSVSGISSLARMVMYAVQRYGLLVTDRSGVVSIPAESGGVGIANDGTYTNPWGTLLALYAPGKGSYNALAGIPWNLLEALPLDFGKPSL